jgi:hypothetical protein
LRARLALAALLGLVLLVLLLGLAWWSWPPVAGERSLPARSPLAVQPAREALPAPAPERSPAPEGGLPFEVEPGDLVQSEAEMRLEQLEMRYRAHLAHLEMTPDRVVDSRRLPQLLAQHHALAQDIAAIAELADPEHTQEAVTRGAELDRAFAAWLEAASEAASEPALVRELESLADQHYASAERGFALARELGGS